VLGLAGAVIAVVGFFLVQAKVTKGAQEVKG